MESAAGALPAGVDSPGAAEVTPLNAMTSGGPASPMPPLPVAPPTAVMPPAPPSPPVPVPVVPPVLASITRLPPAPESVSGVGCVLTTQVSSFCTVPLPHVTLLPSLPHPDSTVAAMARTAPPNEIPTLRSRGSLLTLFVVSARRVI